MTDASPVELQREPRDRSRVAVVVLGMHRSGTSVITRAVGALGVELGERLMPEHRANPSGFWENMGVYELNECLLEEMGSSWDGLQIIDSSAMPEVLRQEFRHRAAQTLVREFGEWPVFGFKDPRLPRLLPVWQGALGALGVEDRYVIAFRNPVSVAHSLAARDGFAHEKSHLLWLVHVVLSLRHTEGKLRALVDYDDFMASPADAMSRIAMELKIGATVERAEIERFASDFVSNALRHTSFDGAALRSDPAAPAVVVRLYSALRRAATGAVRETEALAAALAVAEAAFADLAPALALSDALDRRVRELEGELEGHARVVAELGEATNKWHSLTRELELASREVAMLRGEREWFVGERERLTHEIGRLMHERRELEERWRVESAAVRDEIEASRRRELAADLLRREAESAYAQLESALAICEASARQHQLTNEALLSSTSWAVTAPLRSVSRALKRMGASLRAGSRARGSHGASENGSSKGEVRSS